MTDIEFMKKYLKQAVTLERFVYVWSNALSNVNAAMKRNARGKEKTQSDIVVKEIEYSRIADDVMEQRESEKKDAKSSIGFIPLGILSLIFIYGLPFILGILKNGALGKMLRGDLSFIEALKKYIIEDSDLGVSGTIVVVVLVILVILTLIFTTVMTISEFIKKNKSKHWEKEIAKKQSVAQKEKDQLYNSIAIYDNKSKLLQGEKNQILMNLKKATEERAELYSKNILPEKYRNLIAVSTMYEYLITGRCTTVQGHGGIIDTYEYDCKFGMIIQNLIEINKKLDVIAANQQMLHEELSIANSHLQAIQSDINRIEVQNRQIVENTAISAIANQQTAAIAQSMQLRAWYNGF